MAAGWSARRFRAILPFPSAGSGERPAGIGAAAAGRIRSKSVQHHEAYHRTGRPPEGAEPCPERRRAADDDPDSVQRAAAGRGRAAGPERDRHGSRDRRAGRRAGRARRPDDRAGPHALRHRPQIARGRPGRARDAWAGATRWCCAPGRSTFTLACLPPEDYPVMSAGELPHHFALSAARIAHADRPHPVRDLDRGDAVLPERHLPARDEEQRGAGRPRRRDRRPPAGAGRDDRARGRGRHAGHHRAAQDRAGIAQAGRGRRRGGPDRARRDQDPRARSARPS